MSIRLKVINLLLHVILDNTFMENYILENKQKQVVLFYIFGNLSRVWLRDSWILPSGCEITHLSTSGKFLHSHTCQCVRERGKVSELMGTHASVGVIPGTPGPHFENHCPNKNGRLCCLSAAF